MKKSYFLLLLFLGIKSIFAQVGINTTTPNAQLEIKSSDQAAPSNTDGILIPKVDLFPATNPTAAQQGMLVYLTTTSGTDLPGFYYWDNTGTPSWKPITGTNVGTLDQAYDFGGAGNGKTITADAGAVTIDGTDGLVSTGVYTSGAIAPSGPGTRMVWNPRKAAFRAGDVDGTQWDDENIGIRSVAFGLRTTASGNSSSAFGQFSIASGAVATAFGRSTASGLFSTSFGYSSTASNQLATAFGFNTTASGNFSTAFGYETEASGDYSTSVGTHSTASGNFTTALGWNTTASGNFTTAFGYDTEASGEFSTAFGQVTTANGKLSTSFGRSNTAKSYGETALGIGATDYTPSTNGDTQFRTANATDRLFVIGNAIDANNNDFVDESERSDALIILKNGLTRLPSTTNAMINAADGKTVVTKEWVQDNNSTFAWSITGNAGINPVTNFIGTTDDADVIFKRNNVVAGRISADNNAFGRAALRENTSGVANNAFGTSALQNNTTASFNNAFGSLSLQNNITGNENNAFGSSTLQNNTTGSGNNAFGLAALYSNTSGFANNAFGRSALQNNTTGSSNNAFGNDALKLNTTGGNNSAFGFEALKANTTGTNNIAMGFQSLLANTIGTNNVAIGVLALDVNTTGIDNTAVGRNTLGDNISGNSNTAIGRDALFNSTGNNNTAIGRGTLSGVTTGSNNSGLGFDAQVANPTNSNQVRIGNTAVTLVSAQVALSITSDSRWKTNIQPSNLGLDFINELQPVFYTRKDVAVNEGKTTILETTSNPTTEYGFIAQDLESALLKFGATNNGIINKDSEGMYGVRYNDLLAPMVKAIQEQQAIIEELKAKIEALEKK